MAGQEVSTRCLGAFLVRRKEKARPNGPVLDEAAEFQRRHLEELVTCATHGSFQRFNDSDIAYVCDFCDGHLIWEDLDTMPTVRTMAPEAPTLPPPRGTNPNWQATGISVCTREKKQVIFPSTAVANHGVPRPGDWQARLICPFCEESGETPLDEDDDDDPWRPDVEFEDVDALQEHMEWEHPTPAATATAAASSSCVVM